MSPSQDDVMLALGYVTYETQETEATLHLVMSLVFGLSVAESIEHLKKIYAKKTLGQFLDLLRAKIGISPEFDEFMTDYIEQRNFITHNISRTTIFSPYTDLGREKLMNLLTSFRFMNRKAKLTFMALTEAWMRLALTDQENETRLSALKESGLLQEIERDFIPELSKIFGRSVST
ncbi:hypothetical protein [Pseudomonas sp.]|uniref:hypothetical protein n=1 Tax=Pseudomonas sp. TaxID=306 RepID=UPI0027318BEA|nr:hypothetical protein [Pseudomonas sp.]MDP2243547.1 hypothetical protein [Pseudomonas sp.]